MLMVISPAKTLDYETPPATARFTLPEHLEHSSLLIEQLRELTPAQIGSLMSLSDKLAGLNAVRFSSWTADFTPQNAKQALLAFKGDVYTGLNAEDFSEADFDHAQQHLRVLQRHLDGHAARGRRGCAGAGELPDRHCRLEGGAVDLG